MQILLQDFTDYWPMMGHLSPTLQRQLQHELVPLVPPSLLSRLRLLSPA